MNRIIIEKQFYRFVKTNNQSEIIRMKRHHSGNEQSDGRQVQQVDIRFLIGNEVKSMKENNI